LTRNFPKNLIQYSQYVISNAVATDGRRLDVGAARDFTYQKQNRSGRVIEAELDMNRLAERPSTAGRILELWRWLMPLGRHTVGTPKRSVERELEEAWPSNDP
jgi:hypothetical protein